MSAPSLHLNSRVRAWKFERGGPSATPPRTPGMQWKAGCGRSGRIGHPAEMARRGSADPRFYAGPKRGSGTTDINEYSERARSPGNAAPDRGAPAVGRRGGVLHGTG